MTQFRCNACIHSTHGSSNVCLITYTQIRTTFPDLQVFLCYSITMSPSPFRYVSTAFTRCLISYCALMLSPLDGLAGWLWWTISCISKAEESSQKWR
ncbi:uncharacterized protein LY89DRAFT_332518 [Mollisia scopiformis]|uniref:Uncharacterized protein n=1 Tax=Mollisia scopiformis TaxID=149040 RepID=A0A132B8E6_MOLSC|nr:uncharacterized protein LY89DRAFT_332518 [Mollisia scopiformis]KUJ08523.1 hypothetical protein LY89DRAFT_332518 [Mollisia scopiformis]